MTSSIVPGYDEQPLTVLAWIRIACELVWGFNLRCLDHQIRLASNLGAFGGLEYVPSNNKRLITIGNVGDEFALVVV